MIQYSSIKSSLCCKYKYNFHKLIFIYFQQMYLKCLRISIVVCRIAFDNGENKRMIFEIEHFRKSKCLRHCYGCGSFDKFVHNILPTLSGMSEGKTSSKYIVFHKGKVIEIIYFKYYENFAKIYGFHRKEFLYVFERNRRNIVVESLIHEINNPVSEIMLLSNNLKQRNGEKKTFEIASRISESCNHINEMIKYFSKIDSSVENDESFEKVNILNCLEKCLLFEFSEAGNKIIKLNHVDCKQAFVMGNQQQILSVLINVIKNSVEAVKDIKSPMISIVVNIENEKVNITVKDNAKSFDIRNREDCFAPYFSTKDGNKGLGLFNSKKIVQRHKGLMSIDIEEGATTVRLCFPLLKDSGVMRT